MVSGNNLIIELGGRLGNMLFSMTAGAYYARKFGKGNVFVHFRYANWKRYYDSYTRFQIYPEWKGPNPMTYPRVFNRNDYVYEDLKDFPNENVYFDGSFESELFFPDREFVDGMWRCPDDVESRIRETYPDIDECVGISVRRGDYLHFRDLFYVPKASWYLDMYDKYFRGRPAIVFSDDIEWCKANLRNENFVYYENTHTSDQYFIKDPVSNIYAMALCKDHICSCSTWSWWGARLCERDGAVNVFHDKRFKPQSGKDYSTYVPDRWIKENAEYE